MNRLNADGHDESQYLPKKWINPKSGKEEDYPVVNECRAKKGDIVQLETDGGLNKALTWLPDKLNHMRDDNGKELLNRDYLHICESIYKIVMSARHSLGISDLRSFIGGEAIIQVGILPSDPFFAILSKLMPYQSNMVLWVVCDEYNRGNIALARKCISSILGSLDMAKKVIDDCRPKE